mmetsp:Transcript_15617/g.25883  ORF Transcript_15617/g.25883 Transcript_15617/m.25883 type:complete len:494 (-) Transcript_15617:460-1941(-)
MTFIKNVLVPTLALDPNASVPFEPSERYVKIDVEIEGEIISKVSRHEEGSSAPDDAIDASKWMILPGFVNCHTHSGEMWTRGQVDPFPLELWLEQLYKTHLEPEMLYYSSMATAVETLLSGGTAVMDHVVLIPGKELECLEWVVKAYEDTGIRAFIGPLMGDLPLRDCLPRTKVGSEDGDEVDPSFFNASYDSATTERLIGLMKEAIERFHKRSPNINIAVAPTGIQLCTDALYIAFKELSEKHDLIRHTHFLETKIQKHLAQEKYNGQTAGEHLLEIGFLDYRTTCAHSIHLVDRDIEALAKASATAVHNPLSNLRLGSGISPILDFQKAGVNVTFGCDGSASNDSQDLLEAIKVGTILHAITRKDYRQWPSAYDSIRLATQGGAKAINMTNQTGFIGVGRKADIALYDLCDLSMLPLNDPIGMLVLGRPVRGVVREVWVNGRHVVSQGKPTGIDMDTMCAEIIKRSSVQMTKPVHVPSEMELYYRKVNELD